MDELGRLADQIRRAFEGESWHGPAVMEVLAGVSAQDAAAHPVAGAHSIWEIVLHLVAGYRLVLRRIRGERVQLSVQEEWPPVPVVTPEAWRETERTLEQLNRELQEAVRVFAPGHLGEPLGSDFSAYAQLVGVPQHDLYHAGQMTLLKKVLAASSRSGRTS